MRTSLKRVMAVCLVLVLLGCEDKPTAPTPKTMKPTTPRAAFAPDDWPIFRGNPAMTGVARGRMADELELAWTFTTGREITASPIIKDGRVFLGSKDGHVYAIDLQTGEQVWKQPLGEVGRPAPIEASPMAMDGRVYIGATDGVMYVLDENTGEILHRHETEASIFGSANWLTTSRGNAIVFGSYDNNLYCLDAETFEPRWSVTTDDYVHAAGAVVGTTIYIGGCDGELRVIDGETGKALRSITLNEPIIGNPAATADRVYLGHHGGVLECADGQSGAVVWRYEASEKPYHAPPAVMDRVALVGGHDREMHAVDAVTGEPMWTYTTRDEINSAPVIVGDSVVFGSDDGRLYVLGLLDGSERWQYDIGRPVSASVAVGGGHLVVTSEDGKAYAFKESQPSP